MFQQINLKKQKTPQKETQKKRRKKKKKGKVRKGKKNYFSEKKREKGRKHTSKVNSQVFVFLSKW